MTTEAKVRQNIYSYSKKISNEVAVLLDKKFEADALDLIAEMAYKKLQRWGADLEAFQKHAKRSTINVDDVKLLTRNNDSLKKLINEKAQFIAENKPAEQPAKKKRKVEK